MPLVYLVASTTGFRFTAHDFRECHANSTVISTIIGAHNLEQLNDNLDCLKLELSPEERAAITALSINPPLATDR